MAGVVSVGDMVGGSLWIRVGSPCQSSSTDLTLDTRSFSDSTLELCALDNSFEEDFINSDEEVSCLFRIR